MQQPSISLFEDDAFQRNAAEAYLANHDLRVIAVENGIQMRRQISRAMPDLVLLDVQLPGHEDGFALARWLRESNTRVGIIMLTAAGDAGDKVLGLESGADDYVAKPYEPRELLARIRIALRRSLEVRRETRQFGPLLYDLESGVFFIDEAPLTLRRTEALVLEALMARPGAVIQRETLEARVYGYDKVVNANSLESQISRLRTNLARRTDRVRIRAVRGLGYCLADEG